MTTRALSRYLDRELPAEGRERVRRHLAACPRCAGALEAMWAVERAIQRGAPAAAEAPDLVSRVTGSLRQRGAFFSARVAAGRRRLFGERRVPGHRVAALGLAASLVLLAVAGLDRLTQKEWARETAPVLADAERVLVRLVWVDPVGRAEAMRQVRAEAKELDLSGRLARARAGAKSPAATDLQYLQRAFAMLANGDSPPRDMAAGFDAGDLLVRTERLREGLATGP